MRRLRSYARNQLESKNAGLAVLPAKGDVAWRLRLGGLQPRFLGKINQAYQALAGTRIAMNRIVISQPQRGCIRCKRNRAR